MSWADVLDNPEHLRAFFDGSDGLEHISLFEVSLDRDGPRLKLRANLFRFPDRRSPRWHESANRAQITLSLWITGDLEIRGWSTTMDGILSMQRISEAEVQFSFGCPGVTIQGRSGMVRLERLTAYVEGTGHR